MPRRRTPRSRTRVYRPRRARGATARRSARKRRPSGFVGRDGSPVLDRYPPRVSGPSDARIATRSVAPAPAPASVPPAPSSATPPAPPPAPGLLNLERPFDIDGFSQLLGETAIRVEVPKEDLPEVLRRVTDFMGFGIYVYAIRVHPASDEMLRRFVVELHRVDFSPAAKGWVEFQEKGRSDSPFGPGGSP